MKNNKLSPNIFDAQADGLAKLSRLFPSAVKDGLLDIAALKEELGQFEEVGAEKYELTWAGKQAAKKLSQTDIAGRTLKYIPEDSKDADTTQNLYIEGDNLEVLKLLRQNYYGAVKMIYIDPPYNTGNDFVYRDDFAIESDQSDIDEGDAEEGDNGQVERLIANQKSSNRFHANWLNMMLPRLRVAKDLLQNDGVIFISIDDGEIHNARKLCDEVFGSNNFIVQFIWERAFAPKNDAKYVSSSHDYVLMYAKSLFDFQIGKLPRTEEANNRYKNPDDDHRGDWISGDLTVKTYNPNTDYEITTPSGNVVKPPHGVCWRVSKEKFAELVSDNRIWFGESGSNVPRLKRFLSEIQEGMTPTSILFHKNVGHSQEGRQEVRGLFEGEGLFDGPKPIRLLYHLLILANTDENSIIMDFFSGSASAAHAVMQLNAEDGGNRQFIMVQVPEATDEKSEAAKAGYHNICEIGKERIRRAGEKIKSTITYPQDSKNGKPRIAQGVSGGRKIGEEYSIETAILADQTFIDEETGEYEFEQFGIKDPKNKYRFKPELLDIGFRVFRTADTNIRWTHLAITEESGSYEIGIDGDNNIMSDKDNLDFMPGYTDIDVVYEILLRQRDIPLSAKVEKLDIGKRTYLFADAYVVCLDDT
ncbi:MAG: site-specific DNA-methyltransferase, partial [Defluviitaleaceae bacterium]|nr:site-specific DNA-methyltransferase [Defluviitaleaceae bacterium]